MSLQPCSVHGQNVPGQKLATLFTAWHNEDGRRVSYKLKLCVECLTNIRDSLLKSLSSASPNVCVCSACGKESSQDISPLYLTLYVPKQEGREYALTTCTSCATSWRESFLQNGMLQPDRFNGQSGTTGFEDFQL